MTNHAGLILGGKRGQGGLFLVAGAALFVTGSGGIKSACLFSNGCLAMGIVAVKASFVFLLVLDLHGPVETLAQPLQAVVMAGQALICLEELSPRPDDVSRVWMGHSGLNFLMAVLTRGLAMNGRMESPRLYQPRSICGGTPPP